MIAYLAIPFFLTLAFFGGWLLDSAHRRRERAFDRRERAWEEERRQLLNRLMYAQGKPWEGPPEHAEVFPTIEEPTVVDPLMEAL